jgi:hypothetical protein
MERKIFLNTREINGVVVYMHVVESRPSSGNGTPFQAFRKEKEKTFLLCMHPMFKNIMDVTGL